MFLCNNKGSWNTSNVTDMNTMFRSATNANPDTSGWNTSSVTTMSSMFRVAPNANPDTSGWNTSNVTSMAFMFSGATSANPIMSSWNFSKVTNMSNIFSTSVPLSVSNYSDMLNQINATSAQTSITLSDTSAQYRVNPFIPDNLVRLQHFR